MILCGYMNVAHQEIDLKNPKRKTVTAMEVTFLYLITCVLNVLSVYLSIMLHISLYLSLSHSEGPNVYTMRKN